MRTLLLNQLSYFLTFLSYFLTLRSLQQLRFWAYYAIYYNITITCRVPNCFKPTVISQAKCQSSMSMLMLGVNARRSGDRRTYKLFIVLIYLFLFVFNFLNGFSKKCSVTGL